MSGSDQGSGVVGAWRNRKAMPIYWRRCRRCAAITKPGGATGGGRPAAGGSTAPGQGVRLAGTVRFLGTRRDLPEIYRALDLFVQPSLWEGLPLALLKAMGAGLTVVATRVSGSREAIVDGVNGFLVAPGDPEALVRALGELCRHPEARQRLGDTARGTVVAQYSLEAMLHRLEDLYLELWRRGNPSSCGR